MNMCCLQKVRWRGQEAQFIGGQGSKELKGRKYNLWWSGNNDGIGGVEILVKKYARRL